MKKLLLILALPFLVFGCNSQTEKTVVKDVKPIELGFYEVYSETEATPVIQAIGRWTLQYDSLLLSKQIKHRNFFHLIQTIYNGQSSVGEVNPEHLESVIKILSLEEIRPLIPKGMKFMLSLDTDDSMRPEPSYQLYAVKIPEDGEAMITGKEIKEAFPEKNLNMGSNVITVTMTEQGTELWTEMTRSNINKCIAIVLDERVVSCPIVMGEISSGRTQISGNFTNKEAANLAAGINAGR